MASSWWNCERFYRSEVNVSATGSQSDYAVQLQLSNADFHTGYQFSDDGSDLLVVDEDNTTQLSFFIEHWDAAERQATISINVPLLSSTPRTLYLYYGTVAGSVSTPLPPPGDAAETFVESGWRMHTRFTPLDPTSEAEARTAFADLNDGTNGYGCAALDTLNGRNNQNTFSGPNGNFGLLAETHFYADIPGVWSFRLGSDFGLGGGLFVNGIALDERWNDDLWWGFNWNNADVLVGTIELQSGYHHIEALGYEGCCDGSISVQFKTPSSLVWRDLNTSNLSLYGRSCPPGNIDQNLTATATPTFFTGSVFYDNGSGGVAHDGIRQNNEQGVNQIQVSATVTATGSSSSDHTDSDGNWRVCFLDETAGNDIELTTALPSTIVPVSETAPVTNSDTALNSRIVLNNVADSDHDNINFGVIETPVLTTDRTLQLTANSTGTLTHSYSATTAAEVDFQISLTQQQPSMAFDYIAYRDADCDGVTETPALPLNNPINVSAGDTVCIVLEVSAGNHVDSASLLELQIDARSRLANSDLEITLGNTDIISGRYAGELIVDKRVCNSTSNSCEPVNGSNFSYTNSGLPGETLHYRIMFSSANNSVTDVTISDSVPQYSTLEPLSISMQRLPAGVNCTLSTPGDQTISNYRGDIEWSCDGAVSPSDPGIFTFSVVID